jgi:TP901 family phage tail tape measure protein
MAGATNTVRIDIELLTKEAQQQVKMLNTELNKIGKGMDTKAPEIIEQTGKNLKSTAVAYDNYARAQETAGLKISSNVTKLKGLKTQMSQNDTAINAQKKSLDILTKTYDENDKRVDEAKSKLAEMRSQQALMSAKVDELSKKYGNLIPKMAAAIDKQMLLSQRMNRIGTSMTNLGKAATMTMTAPIIGAFGVATHAASQYQYELQDIRKEVEAQGYSAKQVNSIMKNLSSETLEWSRKYGVSTSAINKNMFELVSNGYNVKQSMGMMPGLLKTMTANSDKTGKSIELTSSMLEQFGLNIGSNSKVIANGNALMNQMTEATHKSALKLDDLKVISGNAGAAMHAMGISTSDFLAMAGRLKSAGIDASSVGTGLSSMMTRIGTGTGQAAADLKKYNIQVFDSAGKMKSVFGILGQMQEAYKGMNDEERQKFMYDVVGQENMKVGMTLMDANLGRYKSLSSEIKNSTGTVDKYNKTMRDTNQFTEQKFMATLKSLEIAFGQKLLPAVTPLLEMFTKWIDDFSKLNGSQQQFIVKVGLMVAAIGPLLVIGGSIFKLIGNISKGIGGIQTLFGKSQILAKIELENGAYGEQLALLKEINAQKEIGEGTPQLGTNGTSYNKNPVSKVETGISEAEKTGSLGVKSKWASAGLGSKLFAGAAAVDAASSFWGAIQTQSTSQRNQAMWEGGGKTAGLVIGGVLGGPAGAAAGEFIGGEITKYITIKNVKKFLDDDSKNNTPDKKHKDSKVTQNMKTAPHDHDDNLAVDEAEWVRKNSKNSDPGKETKKFKSEWKDAFESISGYSANSLGTFEKFQSSVNKKIDSETSKQKKDAKASLKWLLDNNKITRKQYNADIAKLDKNTMAKQAKKDTKAVVQARSDLNKKLKAINNEYKKLEQGKSRSEVKNLEKQKQQDILQAHRDGDSKIKGAEQKLAKDLASIETKSSKKQNSILKQLKNSAGKISNQKAAALIKSSYNAEQKQIANAEKTRKSEVAVAKKKKDQIYATANQQIDGVYVLSKKERTKLKKDADQKYEDAKKAAQKKKEASISNAKDEHTQVVEEAKKTSKGLSDQYDTNTGDAKSWWSDLGDWFSAHSIIASIKQVFSGSKGKGGKSHALGGAITTTHTALVGEEGPELAYSKKTGKARILGKYGPEVTTVFAGENILTAPKTKQALKGKSAQSIPSFANGAGSIGLPSNKIGGVTASSKLDVKISDKDVKKGARSVKKQIDDMTKKSKQSLQKFTDFNKKNWKEIYKDTDKSASDIKDTGTDNLNLMSKNISNIDTTTAKFWHRDWIAMATDFNVQMSAIIGYARQDMNGAIGQLNHGISNINGLVGKFGGNSAILPAIPAFANGTNGALTQDELALVNDGHGPNYRELIQHNDGSFTMHKDRDKVVPLKKGERVFNGQQSNYLINQGLVTPHADGTVPDSALTKMVEDKIKNPAKAWNTDFSNQVSNNVSPDMARSMAMSAKKAISEQGVPWYQAVWDVIKDEMGIGSGSRGAFLKYAVENYMGKPYLMGGDGPTYYDCSGMVAAALKHFGVDIGRTTTNMQTTTSHINYGDSKPGDLSIWGDADGALGHVGIVMDHNGTGKMFNETPPHAKYDPIRREVGIPWKGTFRINQLSDEDPNMPKVSPRLKALAKKEIGSKALNWISNKFQPEGATSASGVSPTPTGGHSNWMAAAGIPANEMAGYSQIISAESGWNPHATNPSSGAYGLPQSLPGSKMASAGSDWRTNPITQLKWMKSYVNGRYGSIQKALAFRRSVGWYADGGWGQNGKLNVFNETPGENEIVVNPHRKSVIKWLKGAMNATAKLQPHEFQKAFAPVELPEEMKNIGQNISLPTEMEISTPEMVSNYHGSNSTGVSSNSSSNNGMMASLIEKISEKSMNITVNIDSQTMIAKNIPLINALLGSDSVNIDLRGGSR